MDALPLSLSIQIIEVSYKEKRYNADFYFQTRRIISNQNGGTL
jgi:hypothetical protein